MATRTCVVCGVTFKLRPYWKHDRLTCSKRCRYALTSSKLSDKEIRICEQCDKEFAVYRSSHKKLCSLSCKLIYMKGRLAGPNNPNWKEVKKIRPASKRSLRNHIKTRDNVCQDCGSNKSLQVHHIDSNPTNNGDDNLVLLCKSCHASRHKEMGEQHLVGLILVNRTYSHIPPRNCVICGASFKPKGNSQRCCSPECGRAQSGLSRRK